MQSAKPARSRSDSPDSEVSVAPLSTPRGGTPFSSSGSSVYDSEAENNAPSTSASSQPAPPQRAIKHVTTPPRRPVPAPKPVVARAAASLQESRPGSQSQQIQNQRRKNRQQQQAKKAAPVAQLAAAAVSTAAAGTKKKPAKKLSGIRALRAIRSYQMTTKLSIPKTNFIRIVREVTRNVTRDLGLKNGDFKFTAQALLALQEVTEVKMVELFEDVHLLALHANRVTIDERDFHLKFRLTEDESILPRTGKNLEQRMRVSARNRMVKSDERKRKRQERMAVPGDVVDFSDEE